MESQMVKKKNGKVNISEYFTDTTRNISIWLIRTNTKSLYLSLLSATLNAAKKPLDLDS